MNPLNLLNLFKSSRAGRTDVGILKVAFLVAALDGEVTAAEYETFDLLAKRCRGVTPESVAEALKAAMRSAGYLLLLSPRVGDDELVRAFIAEAEAALPDGFACLSLEEVRRAVVLWIAMGMSDGDYSARERLCLEALRRRFAELRVTRNQEDAERWQALAQDDSSLNNALWGNVCGPAELITRDFVQNVEKLASQMGDSQEAAEALKALVED